MKKSISIIVSALLSLSVCVSAFAADLPSIIGDGGQSAVAVSPQSMYGNIIEETDHTIVVQNGLDENDSVVLNLLDSTCIIDAQTGQPASIEERTGDRVAVYYGPAVTLSLPPQSNAIVVAVNLPEASYSPHYAIVESIERNDDSVRILTNGGSLYVTINRDTPIYPYLTRNLVTIDQIREGTELLLWYDIVAMSYPGQTTSLKTVVLRNPDAGVRPADQIILSLDAGIASVNRSEVNLLHIRYLPDGTPTLPLRQLGEALGYDVRWISETGMVELTREAATVKLQFGHTLYNLNGTDIQLNYAPMVEDGVTFVPVDFFSKILGVDLKLTDFGV